MQYDNTWVIALALVTLVPVLFIGNKLDKRYGHGNAVEDHPMTASLVAIPFLIIMLIFDFGWRSISVALLYTAVFVIVYLVNKDKLKPVKKGGLSVSAVGWFALAPIITMIYLLILSKIV